MLSELYRPQTFDEFVGQSVIDDIRQACADPWTFGSGGERWLFESDGVAGCGKTSAAYAAARALGCSDVAVNRIDSRAVAIADFRELERTLGFYGMGSDKGRKSYIIDEIQHLNPACARYLLGFLEALPRHVIVIGTTTSVSWADEVDGLFSRWRRFRFRKPDAKAIADHLERIAREQGIPIPDCFPFLGYVQGKVKGLDSNGNNVRACIDQLPDALRSYGRNLKIKAA